MAYAGEPGEATSTMKAYVHADGDHMDFLWNVDCSVGQGGQNNLEADVSYIQWYYKLAAAQPATPPERREVYGQVRVTGRCDGTSGDPLVQAIVLHQQTLRHPKVDGRISVATGAGKIDGASAFFVLRLGARFAKMFPQFWPRLDLMPQCPTAVAKASLAAIPNPPPIS